MLRLGSIFVLVAIVFATSTDAHGLAPIQPRKLNVVATTYPLQEAASVLGKKRISAVGLFQGDLQAVLGEKQRKQLQNADVVLTTSLGDQPEVDHMLSSIQKPVARITNLFDDARSPYYGWQDPQGMWQIVEQVRAVLSQANPASAAFYLKNARLYASALVRIDKDYAFWLGTCEKRQIFVASKHFDVLARRYGLQLVSIDPSLVDLNRAFDANLAEQLKRSRTSVIYFETLPSLDVAQKIHSQYGVRTAALNPLAVQTPQARRVGVNYVAVMLINLDALMSGLDCSRKWQHRR